MSKNDFRVASISKIIIRICKKNIEICAKTSKISKSLLQAKERERSKNITQFQKYYF